MVIVNILKSILLHRVPVVQYPSFVTYLITWRCNGRCVFCDVWKKHAVGEDELSCEEIGRIFAQFKKMDVLRITGGEPFLRDDLADVITTIDRVSNPSVIHLTSNGLLTDRIIAVMSAIESVKKVHIKISIDDVGGKHDAIRQVHGSYDKAIETVKQLVSLREKKDFHVGVNQAIVSEEEIDAYFRLTEVLAPLGVPIYPCVAFDPHNSLYSGEGITDPAGSVKPFGRFSTEGLQRFMDIVLADGKKNLSLSEQMVNQYHLKGMYNRLVNSVDYPNPACVALANHLRILPNGDVPVCLYNGTIVGNLRNTHFQDIWRSQRTREQRKWVARCPGCWQSCETAVSAIYTGDIWKGLFY